MTHSKDFRGGLTADEARRVLSYNPNSGEFFWTHDAPKMRGKRAGSLVPRTGYRVIGYKKCVYMEHRLAFLLMTGEWPDLQVDHINHDRSDNRWDNLRLATQFENQQNRVQGHGLSRYIGVSFSQNHAKQWCARIMKDGKSTWLGRHACQTAAYVAYCAAKREIHTFATGDKNG